MSDLSGTLGYVTVSADHLALDADLHDDLVALDEQREQLHLDLCPVYRGLPCSCAAGKTIHRLRAWFAVRGDLVCVDESGS